MTAGLLIDRIGRLFTAGPRGVLADAAVVVTDATIAWIGAAGAAPPADIDVDERVDCAGGLVTPGLIDAHTHPVYGGSRLVEIAARSAGEPYGASDGETGIGATVAATRATDTDTLRAAVISRLRSWLAHGATTVDTIAAEVAVTVGPLGEEERAELQAEVDARVARSWGLDVDDLNILLRDFTNDAVPSSYRERLRDRLSSLESR